MKSRITSIILVIVILIGNPLYAGASATQTDPVLTSAIVVQMNMLEQIFSKREKTQQKIIAAESAVTLAMTRMHDVEDKILGYMSNVQAGFQNLYQIKRAAQLVGVEIPKQMALVKKSIGIGHIEGTMMAAVVGDELREVTLEMASLYPFMAQLVTSGSYTNTDGSKKKVNLLDSAERYYICTTIVSKLENINTSLYMLAWEIQTMRYRDLFYKLDPEGWINYMAGRNIVEGIVRDWNYELKYGWK